MTSLVPFALAWLATGQLPAGAPPAAEGETGVRSDSLTIDERTGTWHAKIKIKKCKLGRFVTIWARDEVGHGTVVNGVTEGHFQGVYKPLTTGLYRAKAEYTPPGATRPTLVTDYQHFHIHR